MEIHMLIMTKPLTLVLWVYFEMFYYLWYIHRNADKIKRPEIAVN